MNTDIKKGLMGVTVDETSVSKVMPEINSLTYRGYAAQDLCANCKFEEVATSSNLQFAHKSCAA